jgi:hypothetical protein
MRTAVADDIMQMSNAVAVDDECVIVHRYYLLHQGIMVEVTAGDLLPSWPVARSKFAKLLVSEKKASCANLFVPCLMQTLTVLAV